MPADSPASTHLSYVRDISSISLGAIGFVVLAYLIVTATTNSVNLTDGLDGLAAGASRDGVRRLHADHVLSSSATAAARSPLPGCYLARDPIDLALVAASAMGACFGFLWWNASPAQIFMGDTGSMALGGLMAGIAILSRTELLLVVLGGLFAVDDAVGNHPDGLVQVHPQAHGDRATGIQDVADPSPFRAVGGWQEITIIVRFWIIAGLAVAFGTGVVLRRVHRTWLTRRLRPLSGGTVLVCGVRFAGESAARALLARGARVRARRPVPNHGRRSDFSPPGPPSSVTRTGCRLAWILS